MNNCTAPECYRFPTMGVLCVTHWYNAKGKNPPETAPLNPSLLDIVRGTRRATAPTPFERGMIASKIAGDFKWTQQQIAAVDFAIVQVAKRLDRFTSDDVWIQLGPEFPVTKGMAGRLNGARARGLISNTGETSFSTRGGEHCHNQRLTVWESLVKKVGAQ